VSMPRLDAVDFFGGADAHRRRWRCHAAVGVIAIAVNIWLVRRSAEPFPSHDFGWWMIGIAMVQVTLLVALALVSWSWRDDGWVGSASLGVAAVGTMLVGGVVGSILLVMVGTNQREVPAGPVMMLYDSYGAAIVAGIAASAGVVLWRLLLPTAAEEDNKTRPTAEHRMLRTKTAVMRARLARVPQSLNVVLTVVGATYVIAATAAFVLRVVGAGDADRFTWRLTEGGPVTLARVSIMALVTWMVISVVKTRANPQSLRRIGNVWDILTFWPRSFHPFAVRPYAERAVPELQRLIIERALPGDVFIAAHSQGSVLVYATLAAFPDLLEPTDEWFKLVTMGSPLRSLYARAFPHYFRDDEYVAMRERLFDRWTNVFRYTDHVGRTVFSDDASLGGPPHGCGDIAIGDPHVGQAEVLGHNDYWSEPAVRGALAVDSAAPEEEDSPVAVAG